MEINEVVLFEEYLHLELHQSIVICLWYILVIRHMFQIRLMKYLLIYIKKNILVRQTTIFDISLKFSRQDSAVIYIQLFSIGIVVG